MPLSDIVNKHLIYTYDNGWKYEFWLKSERRIVYGTMTVLHHSMAGAHRCYSPSAYSYSWRAYEWEEELPDFF
ncbi:hypothetical protein C360_06180 [Cryptococcus neoformans Bt15]|nr:hypothetical protein C360_06180 [Cryptococcus neoformans var. grubii Bt15]